MSDVVAYYALTISIRPLGLSSFFDPPFHMLGKQWVCGNVSIRNCSARSSALIRLMPCLSAFMAYAMYRHISVDFLISWSPCLSLRLPLFPFCRCVWVWLIGGWRCMYTSQFRPRVLDTLH